MCSFSGTLHGWEGTCSLTGTGHNLCADYGLFVRLWRTTLNLVFMGTLGGQALKMAGECPPPSVHTPALSLPFAKVMGFP